MPTPQLSFVIVSWNVRAQLRQCLAALGHEREQAALEATVVDNNSQDGSADMVRREFPWVRLMPSSVNLGFAKACNLAAQAAVGDYLVLLNPDTVVAAGFCSDLVREFVHHPKAGVIGGHMLNADGTTQPSVRAFPTLWPLALAAVKLLAHAPWLAPAYLKPRFDYTVSQVVDQVMGACLAVPRSVWQELMGFDEGFYLWFEEVDFCQRVRVRGYEVWYSANLTLTHVRGASFRQLTYFQRHYLFTQSLVRYAGKHLGVVAKNLLLWLSVPYTAVAILLDYASTAQPRR